MAWRRLRRKRRLPLKIAACRAQQADVVVRVRDGIDVGGLQAGILEAEAHGLQGLPALGMLVADEALLFGGGHQFAVDQQCGGGIVEYSTG